MGIELYSKILSLNTARRCRPSKSQLVPNGANFFNTVLYLAGSGSNAPHVRAAVDKAFSVQLSTYVTSFQWPQSRKAFGLRVVQSAAHMNAVHNVVLQQPRT